MAQPDRGGQADRSGTRSACPRGSWGCRSREPCLCPNWRSPCPRRLIPSAAAFALLLALPVAPVAAQEKTVGERVDQPRSTAPANIAGRSGDPVLREARRPRRWMRWSPPSRRPGATVFARVDHAAGRAASAGMDLPEAQLLIFGNPKLGTPVMQEDIRAGTVPADAGSRPSRPRTEAASSGRSPRRCSTTCRSTTTSRCSTRWRVRWRT